MGNFPKAARASAIPSRNDWQISALVAYCARISGLVTQFSSLFATIIYASIYAYESSRPLDSTSPLVFDDFAYACRSRVLNTLGCYLYRKLPMFLLPRATTTDNNDFTTRNSRSFEFLSGARLKFKGGVAREQDICFNRDTRPNFRPRLFFRISKFVRLTYESNVFIEFLLPLIDDRYIWVNGLTGSG